MSSRPYSNAKLDADDPMFAVIQEAYRVFAGPRPISMDVCECCTDPQIQSQLLRLPVAEIPTDYIRDWYSGAYDPGGVSKRTWSHLLPRILEILAAGEEVSGIGLEVSLNRFDTGSEDNWTPQQWRVIDRFQRDFVVWAAKNSRYDLDDVLCMFRLGGWPLDTLLDQVTALPTELLVERFWLDWCGNHGVGLESIWTTAFWEGSDGTTVSDFYTSADLHSRVAELALAENTAPDIRTKAIAVAAVIENASTQIGR